MVVIYQGPYDADEHKKPHPFIIARNHYDSIDALLAECTSNRGKMKPAYLKEGEVLVGYETDQHIKDQDFTGKSVHRWKASSGRTFSDFIKDITQKDFFPVAKTHRDHTPAPQTYEVHASA